jgi:hypothetical protein
MKNWKHRTLVAVIGILGVVVGFTACGSGDDDGDDGEESPEEKTTVERWGSWVDPSSTATVDFTVADDGVVTINVGGTAEEEWNAWKADCRFAYTAKRNKYYTYKFEAWTESGERKLDIQYFYEAGSADLSFDSSPQITNTRQTYTLTNNTAIP